jgi:hypothetical protein
MIRFFGEISSNFIEKLGAGPRIDRAKVFVIGADEGERGRLVSPRIGTLRHYLIGGTIIIDAKKSRKISVIAKIARY